MSLESVTLKFFLQTNFAGIVHNDEKARIADKRPKKLSNFDPFR